jgi:hypothetical protein
MLHVVMFTVSGTLIPPVGGCGISLPVGVADSLTHVGRIGASRALPCCSGLSRGSSTSYPCFVLALSIAVVAFSVDVGVCARLASLVIGSRSKGLCSVPVGLGSRNGLPIRRGRNFPRALCAPERRWNIVGLPGRHGGSVFLLKLVDLARDARLGVVRLPRQAALLLRAKLPRQVELHNMISTGMSNS